MSLDLPLNLLQFEPAEAAVGRELDRIEPELGFVAAGLDMDVVGRC